ncbi:probable receptor-like serine/threonine-protein kinase At5g57670 [Cynara cardunculus var. scolymus]|uniref:Concanavalin A-like lectin/glucanase, subgroup n=1 Tax=Cynara cardunculus var. scolymus TaxID=59895 RepID=A0A103U2R6_CYNCS|nr:probable receptor-like serine/threonine-protein kinase At5g57670 [Cynara cardunculus var. scolymus]KVH27900.1 Concanavalin A-like lectin/glucanase, subgroup [Cynara cardunculus var. scolymus]
MRYIRTGSFKRLFSMKRQSLEDLPKECIFMKQEEAYNNGETESFKKPTWKCFSFEEIYVATNGFCSENMVGKGGYAEVYKGVLEDGQTIAVKRLTQISCDERKEKEFLTEIGTLGHVNHPNVSSLLGCCIDNGLYLIFQFSSKGSVASLLHDENLSIMDWNTRYKIAIGTARGLHYLHKVCPRRIIHRDIKASNVLVTKDFEPQISDFGLAKWLPSQWTHHSIAPIEGTFGHLAPEYFMHGVVDEKTDVFAFGVFLLEILSGKKSVDGSHQSLHGWAKPILNQGEVEKIVDPRLEGAYDFSQLSRLAFAASLCIRASSTWRPTMSEVLEVMFEEEIDKNRWKMPDEKLEEHDEFWGFEDLEFESCDSSTFSVFLQDSVSTNSN